MYLSFDFIIEELLLELSESVVATVIIQIQGVKHVPKHGRVLSLCNTANN